MTSPTGGDGPESEASAVVWGMPRAAVELDTAGDVLHYRRVPRAILERVLAP
jgi:chemotaxis response regulator CheB